MAKFVTGPDVNPSIKSSHATIELLESMTPVDLAMAVPYVRIRRLDQHTKLPVDELPISTRFVRPPQFGKSAETIGGERPDISLGGIKVVTKQQFGINIEEHLEISLTIHRPDALLKTDDLAVVSLFTPGVLHSLEYGWAGGSRHPLINGEGYQDPNTGAIIPSKRTLLFTTARYTFNFNAKGEVEMTIFGYNTAGFSLKNMRVLDTFDPVLVEAVSGKKLPLKDVKTRLEQSETIKRIQSKTVALTDASVNKKNNGRLVKIVDVADEMLAQSISDVAKQYGYDDVSLMIGNFNRDAGTTTEKFGAQSMAGRSIGDFLVPIDDIVGYFRTAFTTGVELNVYNFVDRLFTFCNQSDAWNLGATKNGPKAIGLDKPNVKVIVNEYQFKGKNILSVIAFDERDQVKRFGTGDLIFKKDEMTRANIRKIVTSKGIPYMTLGKGFTFIKDASFEALQNSLISTHKIQSAAGASKTRAEYVEKVGASLRNNLPEAYHEIFMSAIEGSISMYGNFALDTFAQLWLDMHVPLWNGQYNVLEREDTIDRSGFETKIKIMSVGDDPLNTRRKVTREEFEARKLEADRLVEQSQKNADKKKR